MWRSLWLAGLLAACGGSPVDALTETPPAGDERVLEPSPPAEPRPPETSVLGTLDPAPVRWQGLAFGWSPVGVATDASGDVFTLSLETVPVSPASSGPPLVLTKRDAEGHELWRRSLSAPGSPLQLHAQSLAVSPQGELFLAYSLPCHVTYWPCHPASGDWAPGARDGGTAEATGAVLVKLSSTGEFLWMRSQEGAVVRGLGVNSAGTALLLTEDEQGSSGAKVSWYGGEGSRIRELPVPGATALGVDPWDNVLVGGTGPRLSKWTPDGEALWTRALDGAGRGFVASLGTSAKGTVVATGVFEGRSLWGPSLLVGSGTSGQGAFLLVAEADGQPRWGLTTSGEEDAARVLAVDPSGQVVLATSSPGAGGQSALDKYNLAGEWLWHRSLGTTEHCVDAQANTTVTSLSIAPGHDVLLGGVHKGLAKLGVRCTAGNGGFLQDLEP